MNFSHKIRWYGLGLLSITFAGCIPIAHVYPTFNHVPQCSLATEDTVYVFQTKQITKRGDFFIGGWFEFGKEVDLVAVAEHGEIEKQLSLHWNKGLGFWPCYVYSDVVKFKTILYRPRNRTVPWNGVFTTASMRWSRSADIAEQEKQLDALWGADDCDWEATHEIRLPYGTRVTEKASRFLASEYERLAAEEKAYVNANESADSEANRRLTRLRRKVEWLRRHGNENDT